MRFSGVEYFGDFTFKGQDTPVHLFMVGIDDFDEVINFLSECNIAYQFIDWPMGVKPEVWQGSMDYEHPEWYHKVEVELGRQIDFFMIGITNKKDAMQMKLMIGD